MQTLLSINLFLREIAARRIDFNILIAMEDYLNYFFILLNIIKQIRRAKTNGQNFIAFMLPFPINCVILRYSVFLLRRDNNITKQNLRYKSFKMSALALSMTEHSSEAR